MTAKDCLLIGFNDGNFPEFVEMMRGMGEETGTFRDLNLAFTEIDGTPLRCLDLVNVLSSSKDREFVPLFENCDFIWPVLLYLGSYLHRRGFSFDYVNLFHRERELLKRKLSANRFRAIAITTTVYVSPHPIIEIVQFLRDSGVEAPIIVGGPYISNQHKVLPEHDLSQLMAFLGADIYVISSEGEATLAQVLACVRENGDLKTIPNLGLKGREGEFHFTRLETERNDLSREPIDYGLFGADAIGQFVSLRTAKSCPFACNFCGFPQRAGKYEYTDLSYVARELDALAELGGVSTLTFLDDTFNVPKPRFREILKLMIDRKYGFHWNSFYRSDHGDERTIELMAESGCEGVFLGIESGSDTMLNLMNKSARKHHYEKALKKFREVGIITYGSFIIGFPGETMETVNETIEFIETNAPDYYRAQLYYLDPATPVWRDRERFQISGGGFEWSHPTMTHSQASGIIEQMFLNIKNSTWAPQHGFEDWSIYYLQRHGFTRADVKAFVEGFNTLVRHKFAEGERLTEQKQILARLHQIVQAAHRRASHGRLAGHERPGFQRGVGQYPVLMS